jgi:serine/threonine protein kinase
MERVKHVGKGCFSNVFLLKDSATGVYSAIKEIPIRNEQLSNRDRMQSWIMSEINIQRSLQHPNVVMLINFWNDDLKYYLEMEYCELNTVSALLASETQTLVDRNKFGGLSYGFIMSFIKDTCNALAYMHNLDIIHRDIKLGNVLMTGDDGGITFKICDFGFACFGKEPQTTLGLSERDTNFITWKYYKICGSPYYMAPEVVVDYHNYNYTNKIDMWSLGVCLYQILFGRKPFGHMSRMDELQAFFTDDPKGKIQECLSQVTPEIEHFVYLLELLLEIEPERRASSKEILQMQREYSSTDNLDDWEHISDVSSVTTQLDVDVQPRFLEWLLSLK